jgi:hypothetical protein
MTSPVYTTKETASITKAWSLPQEDSWFETSIQEFQNGHGILWLHNGIYPFVIIEGAVKWHCEPAVPIEQNLVKLRLFDTQRELHIWTSSAGLQGRWRIDNNNGETTKYVTSNQVLRGVIATHLFSEATKEKHIQLQTRQYIGFTSGQASFVDMRFVGYKSI